MQLAPPHGPLAGPWRQLCRAYLALAGWRVVSPWPDIPKMVLVAAPHTSNWDGINMLAAAGFYRVKLRWIGKASLVRGPFGGLVRWLGCVPVERGAPDGIVAAMAAAFAEIDRMVLAIPPEGTRDRVDAWKTGYYQIALAAGVPIVMSVLDYGTKTIRIEGPVIPTGDYEADRAAIEAPYAQAVGRDPGRFAPPRTGRSDAAAPPGSPRP